MKKYINNLRKIIGHQKIIHPAARIIIENDFSNLFSIDSEEFWRSQLLEIGGEYQIWANAPEDPALN